MSSKMYQNTMVFKPTITITKKRKACVQCREGKRKCDGKNPCSRCLRSRGKTCTYENQPLSKTQLTIAQPYHQKQLFNVSIRRKYIESYFEGINPSIMFTRGSYSHDIYDNPVNKSQKLQENAILACATRSFGAPSHIYQLFERKACNLASELINNYSYETALGFNYLSYFFWGEEDIHTSHYKTLTLSLINSALRKVKENEEKLKLIKLKLATITIQKASLINPTKMIADSTSEGFKLENLSNSKLKGTMSLDEISNWAVIHCEIENLFYDISTPINYDVIINNYKNLDKRMDRSVVVNRIKLLNQVSNNLVSNVNSMSVTTNIVFIMKESLSALLFCNSSEFCDSCISHAENAVNTLENNDYLIGMGGPQFIIVLHSLFIVAILRNDSNLACRINRLQQKQACIFKSALLIASSDKNFLDNKLDCGENEIPKCKIITPSTPFYWMRFDNTFPVLSADAQKDVN